MKTAFAALLLVAAVVTPIPAAELGPDLRQALESSTYVYIATERKDGSFGTPAEIWFMWHDGVVWVASPTTTWRVKRIRANRTNARVYVGTKDGPAFAARGSLVRDTTAYDRLFTTFAKKYPDGWLKFESRFREGLKDGSRVLIRYDPVGAAPTASPRATIPSPGP